MSEYQDARALSVHARIPREKENIGGGIIVPAYGLVASIITVRFNSSEANFTSATR